MRILFTDLLKHPAYHEILAVGKLSPDGSSIVLEDETGRKILDGKPPIALQPETKTTALPGRIGKLNLKPNLVAKTVATNPLLLRWITRHRQPADLGAGDTLARLLKNAGAERTVAWIKALTGVDCRCPDSQQWLNQRFPYPPPK